MHPQTLAAFLNTDLYRLDAALEEHAWTPATAARLYDHLQRLSQVVAFVTDSHVPVPPAPGSMDQALVSLHTLTEALLSACATLPESRFDATVMDSHDRGLTLAGHLYDYARLSAMLVEWSRTLPPPENLDDWFDLDAP